MNDFNLVQIGLAGQKMGALYSIQKGKLAISFSFDRQGGRTFISKNISLSGAYLGALVFACVSESGAVCWARFCVPIRA
jgi:hypothetical protein